MLNNQTIPSDFSRVPLYYTQNCAKINDTNVPSI